MLSENNSHLFKQPTEISDQRLEEIISDYWRHDIEPEIDGLAKHSLNFQEYMKKQVEIVSKLKMKIVAVKHCDEATAEMTAGLWYRDHHAQAFDKYRQAA